MLWDAGVVVADVSDPTGPAAVAHFGAADDAEEQPADTVARNRRYLGGERTNAHYAQPTPSGDYTLVGAETFPGPFEDTVVPGDHGGIRIFDTSDLSVDSTPSDPYETHVGYIPAPDNPEDSVRTSHDFEVRKDTVFASFYEGGIRAYRSRTRRPRKNWPRSRRRERRSGPRKTSGRPGRGRTPSGATSARG